MAERFTSLLDMFDGGGMGASGSEFKGGGLLSDIANALFQPAGYRERQRGMAETRPRARPMSWGRNRLRKFSLRSTALLALAAHCVGLECPVAQCPQCQRRAGTQV